MGLRLFVLLGLLASLNAAQDWSAWVERGQGSSNCTSNPSILTDYDVRVEAAGDPPSSSGNEDAEFIVAWKEALGDYLGLSDNSTQITTVIESQSDNPWVFESTVTALNCTQAALLQDLPGDACSCWALLNGDVTNNSDTTLSIQKVDVTRVASSSSSKSSSDDKFGTGEIVGIVFGALLIYYCCFMVAAGIFYMFKALVKKIRSREREGPDSEDPEEMDDLGKGDDSEVDEESGTSLLEEGSSEDESDSATGKKESSSGNEDSGESDNSSEDSSTEESSTEESS